MSMNPMQLFADGYDRLWRQVEEYGERDLPKSSMEVLQKIIAKAEQEKRYGHLLKAQLMNASLMVEVAPDSLVHAVRMLRMKALGAEKAHPVLAAVYNSVLAEIVASHYDELVAPENGEERAEFGHSKDYYRKSMENPELLAKHKASEFAPMIEKGADSRIFNNDLLHVLGFRAGDFQTMHDYYDRAGNRRAAMFTALELAKQSEYANASTLKKGQPYVAMLDSLIERYGDLVECGEVAIARYHFLEDCFDVKTGEQIAYIDQALSRWGKWKRMNVLRNERLELTKPGFSAYSRRTEIPSVSSTAKDGGLLEVEASGIRNIQSLTLRVQRIDLKGNHNLSLAQDLSQIRQKAVAGTLQEQTLSFADKREWEVSKDTFRVEGLTRGVWLVECFTDNPDVKPQRELVYVTDLYVLTEELPGRMQRIAVVDITTGQPVPFANVYVKSHVDYKKNFRELTLKCDEKGEVVTPYEKNWKFTTFYPYTADDACFRMKNISSSSFNYDERKGTEHQLRLYTDRSIYRPGQTVHVSLIGYEVENFWTSAALKDCMVELTLRNANYQEVGTAQVTTNQFGVAAADFVLPNDGLTGNFYVETGAVYRNEGDLRMVIRDAGGRVSFSVEEYKRPTFQLSFEPIEGAYQEGDTVQVTGLAKSFAGVGVQGAKVKYKVVRREAWWCWWMHSSRNEVELASGEVETDDDGRYEVSVPLSLPVWEDGSEMSRDDFYRISRFYNFFVEAEVTDQAGESHEGSTYIPLGSRPKAFHFEVPSTTERCKMGDITFALLNASGQPLEGDVRFTIDGKNPKVVKANTPINIYAHNLPVGRHTLEAACEGMEMERSFVLFDADDPTPCYETSDWFYQTESTFPRDGAPVTVMVGSSDPDVHIFYSIFAGDSILESGTIDKDRQLEIRQFAYDETYGSGLRLTYAWVKNGSCHTHTTTIDRPMPDKRLIVKWNTFRDRLYPGQQEEWTLQVTHPDGTPATAQMMAAMYDKSLDEIKSHSWWFSLPLHQWLPYADWDGASFSRMWLSSHKNLKLFDTDEMEFTTFSEDFSSLFYRYRRYGMPMLGAAAGARMMYAKKAGRVMEDAMMVEEAAVMDEMAVSNQTAAFDVAGQEESPQEGGGPQEPTDGMNDVQVRENLNETAFFYPTLMTDKKGEVRVKFTLPESLTTWKFLGLANDEDMNYGQISATAVAQKDVMVQPNMPRFVRVGDKATISTRIINTADRDIKGQVAMILINPDNDELVWQEARSFETMAGKTVNAAFSYEPTGDYPLLICKIVANADGFSDGEQHYLPILPNSELVTNTIPFTQNNPGKVTFNVESLFGKNATQKKLTVEYTNNPAWFMVQSLPFVGDINERNAISLAAAFYSNTIGKYILDQSPSAKQVFESWKQEKGSETSLMSSLEKNQELKNMILSETPWVMNATREREQKQAMANFFDENGLRYRIDRSLELLQKLQLGDGSFSWWEGMEGSPYMTAEVMEYLTRLNMMTGENASTERLLDRAASFLNSFVVKEVREMKQREKEGKPVYLWSSNAMQWIYINSISGRKLSAEEKDAEEYLLDKLKKNIKNESMYRKAKMAVALFKRGDKKLAADYVRSLKEYTVFNEEKGRYFDTHRAGYSWCNYTIPTQVAVIEALTLVTPADEQTIDEMKRWILQEKRTQSWDTPISSVNAVFAFLNGRTNLLAAQEKTKLTLDGKPLATPKATAGMGYVKTAVSGEGVKTFTAEKTSTGVSWGALYGQAMQRMTDIETADTSGLKVRRELLVDGKVVAPSTTFHVGDKVTVRLIIDAERDFDYVQLMDKRAACMEPIDQLSGYHWGYYIAPRDNSTNYYFHMMPKGRHMVEADYYIDRVGQYETGTCTVQCAYSPEYSARAKSLSITVE